MLLCFKADTTYYPLYKGDNGVRTVFDSANNAGCSCSIEMPDSEIGNQAFQTDLTITKPFTGLIQYCQDNMDDAECYYYFRQHDSFDLSIENAAKDGCTVCYGVGPHLWQIPKDELLKTLRIARPK